ncbi:hypothetical protein T310_10176, partial [Rasamsonia emersonii CBS 393.64]
RVIQLREAPRPRETTMDPPDLHGGGVIHASPPANGHAASQLTEFLEVPDTPTPSRWNIPGPLGLVMNETGQENDQGNHEEVQDPPRFLRDGKAPCQASKGRGITKQQRRVIQRPLGNKEALRTPLADISKQFQALA